MLNTLKISNRILDNIVYSNESNDVTLYSLYPLTDTPMIQPIPRLVFKNQHLMGLFLELGFHTEKMENYEAKVLRNGTH